MPQLVTYKSLTDGVSVVHIDTLGEPEDENGPIIRVYLNDEPIFENPKFPESEQQ